MVPRLLLLFLAFTAGCVAVEDGDTASQAAVSADEQVFYASPIRVGLGKWTHIQRTIPAGDPTYLIDVPDPGLGNIHCQIDTYYSIKSTRRGLTAMDDNDGQLAFIGNPSDGPLTVPPDACASATCPNDLRYTGDAALAWGFMVYGVPWTFDGQHGVRLVLRPTTPIVDHLRVEAACH